MKTKTLDKSIKDAVSFLKTCPFKATAVKIELEAQLDRGDYDDGCWDCDDGQNMCGTCDGDGYCYDNESNQIDCEDCDGSGYFDCDNCGGVRAGDYSSVDTCEDFIIRNVSQTARDKLVFGKFYNDGSVDSEFTFTLMIDDIEYAIEYINAFKELASEIGTHIDTSGAGMHIALLNSPKGTYPHGGSFRQNYFTNMANAVQHLMPALLFLASCDHKSRGLNYRPPQCGTNKYSAIHGMPNAGCIEFRVFETCYQKPEALYDYLCTIAKCMQFFKARQTKLDWFDSIGKLAVPDSGQGVSRFYYSTKHIDALNKSLVVLKPDHKTVAELKKERSFKMNKSKLYRDEAKLKARWTDEYHDLKKRLKERKPEIERQKQHWADIWERDAYLRDNTTKEKWIKDNMEQSGFELKEKRVTTYVNRKHRAWISGSDGDYNPFRSGYTITV